MIAYVFKKLELPTMQESYDAHLDDARKRITKILKGLPKK